MSKPPRKPSRYAEVAAELRAAILGGQPAPGAPLPSEDRLAARHGVSRVTIRSALALLRSEGLITTVIGGATYVRDRQVLRLPLSRYSRTFTVGPPGPFEAAAQACGLDGKVRLVSLSRQPAAEDVADRLEIPKGSEVIVRVRHMQLGEVDPEFVQLSTSISPAVLVGGSPLAREEKIPSGVYAAFAEIGHVPTTMTEEVTARMPTPEELETLGLAPGMPVLDVQRVTKDQDGRPIELLRVVSIADRMVLVYDDLPITRGG